MCDVNIGDTFSIVDGCCEELGGCELKWKQGRKLDLSNIEPPNREDFKDYYNESKEQ